MDNASRREPPPKPRFSLFALSRHLVFIAAALVITLLVFEFWGQLGSAMGTVLGLDDSVSKNNGEVSVTVLPPSSAPAPNAPCPKGQKCP